MAKIGRALATFAAVAATAGAVHTVRNLSIIRNPRNAASEHETPVPLISILLPARNEAARITPTIKSVLQQDYPNIEFLILDDASSDATSQVVMNLINGHPHARLIHSADSVPAGWLGKPWACHRLAQEATGEILVFIDADVMLSADAMSCAVALLRESALDVMCPYPNQQMNTVAQRLVQPLLQWSWLTTLPLDIAETSTRPSLTAANGQLLLVTRAMYDRMGGHASVKQEVLEDINFVRVAKAHGGRGGVVDGSAIALCNMYDTDAEMVNGYTKSLWNAFGSGAGAFAVNATLFSVYVLPVALMLSKDSRTRSRALTALIAAAAGRATINHKLRQGLKSEVLMHPLSVLAFNALTVASFAQRRRGNLSWKGRSVTPAQNS